MTDLVYLDRTAYDGIRRRWFVTNVEFVCLSVAKQDGRIRIMLGLTVLEEALPVLHRTSVKIIIHLQLIEKLIDWKCVVRVHGDLVRADAMAYAEGKPPTFHSSV